MNRKKIIMKTVVMFISFFIVYSAFILPSRALPMDNYYKCEPEFLITYNETDVDNPISPYSAPRVIPITVHARIRGVLEDTVSEIYNVNDFYIYLYIDEAPEWCKVSVNPPFVKIPVNEAWKAANATLSITLDKNAPAFTDAHIKIRLKSKRMGNSATVVPEGNKTQKVPFRVGYVPILAINTLEGNYKVLGPNEVANFPIEIINLGNGITKAKIDILSVPKGWQVNIIQDVTLGTIYYGGGIYKSKLNLSVKPPIDFGYHQEREVIKISITPYSDTDSNLTGESYLLSFAVYSRGFSTPGFEGILLVLGIIIFLSIFRNKKLRVDKVQSHKKNFEGGRIK